MGRGVRMVRKGVSWPGNNQLPKGRMGVAGHFLPDVLRRACSLP